MFENSETAVLKASLDLSKVFRLGAMLQALRTEVRDIHADEASLRRLASIHNEIESQLVSAVPTELEAELVEFSACCRGNPNPSKAEIRVAQAQLIGWIEGLLEGVQFTIANAQREVPPAEQNHREPADQGGYNPNAYL